LEVTWTNPVGCDLPVLPQTSIRVNGTEVNTVAPNQTRAIVPTARRPGGIIIVEVVNSSGFPATCCFQGTDDQGMIRTNKWLVLGPFPDPFGCNGDNDSILGNHIAPSHICQQYPEEGDEIDYDPAQAVSTASTGPNSGHASASRTPGKAMRSTPPPRSPSRPATSVRQAAMASPSGARSTTGRPATGTTTSTPTSRATRPPS